MEIAVHSAEINDKSGARIVLSKMKGRYHRMKLVWGDKGYDSRPLEQWVETELEVELEVVKHPWDGQRKQWTHPEEPTKQIERPSGFVVLRRRWVVERTFAWADNYRRLSKDYEYDPEMSEAMFQGAMIHVMVRRLARIRHEKSIKSSF